MLSTMHSNDTFINFPMCIILWIHFYHVVFFKLTNEDMFHHVLFVSLLPLPGYVYDWGILKNCLAFFICGFPGALIYTLLVFQKCGYFINIKEEKFSAFVNIFIRTPGILISAIILYKCYINGVCLAPTWAVVLQFIIGPFNAVYYTKQSIERYIRKL